MTTQIATQQNATGLIHLYLVPSVHVPVWNFSPIRQRRNTGIVYAIYRPITEIEVTARNATGGPSVLGRYGGKATIGAKRPTNNPAQGGVRFFPPRRHGLSRGPAP